MEEREGEMEGGRVEGKRERDSNTNAAIYMYVTNSP